MPSESGDKDISGKPLPVILMRFLDSLTERFTAGKHEKRNRSILIFATAFFLTLLIIPSHQFIPTGYKAGDIATSDIRATQDYLLEDRPLTEKKRAEAESAAPFVYTYNANAALETVNRFEKAFALIREARSGNGPADVNSQADTLSGVFGVSLADEEVKALNRVKSDRALVTDLTRLSGNLYNRKIVADSDAFAADLAHGILVVNAESRQEIAAGDYKSYIDEDDARDHLLKGRVVLGGDARDLEIVKRLLARMVTANISLDRNATDEKRREARASVRPVLFKLKRGEMVVRVGERVTEDQALKLEKMFQDRHGINSVFVGGGIFGLVLVLFYFPYRFARKNIRKFDPSSKDLLLICLLTVCNFAVLKIAFVASSAMGGPFPSD